jgi:HPt (histidine-containing phosphotransfer) domain-containing protein
MAYQHIDLAFLEQFTKGDKSRMAKYIRMFLQAAPPGIEAMRTHYQARDWEQLKSAAHSLKPQVGYMGIASIKEAVQRIEEFAREQKRLEEVPQLIERVHDTCEAAFGELRQAAQSLESQG